MYNSILENFESCFYHYLSLFKPYSFCFKHFCLLLSSVLEIFQILDALPFILICTYAACLIFRF